MSFKFKLGLLPKVIIATAAGILSSLFFPLWAIRILVTFTTQCSLPLLLSAEELTNGSNLNFAATITSYFNVNMPPLMGVTTALILTFVIGLGVASINRKKTKALLNEFRDIIMLIIEKAMIPLLPLYIFSF